MWVLTKTRLGKFGIRFCILCLTFPICGQWAEAQNKFEVSQGTISFTSNAKLELINASSDKVRGLIDPATSQFAFVVKVQSFEGFNSELQRQHFNERYLETEKFYEATFSGKIIELVDFSKAGTWEVRAKGNLTIHGKKQVRIIKGKIIIGNNDLSIESEFTVPLADHDISIPQIVSQKIATEILVTFKARMVSSKEK